MSARSPYSFTTNSFASQSLAFPGRRGRISGTSHGFRAPRNVAGEPRPKTAAEPQLLRPDGSALELPRLQSSWSGTHLVHAWELRPVPDPREAPRENVRHTPGPAAWGEGRAASRQCSVRSISTPQLPTTQTKSLWIAQRFVIPEHSVQARVERRQALAMAAGGPQHGKADRTRRLEARLPIQREPGPQPSWPLAKWDDRFVHGSPLLDGLRRWPDATRRFREVSRPSHRFGLSSHPCRAP